MNGKYNSEWILPVLSDIREFCKHNNMPNSAESIDQALNVAAAERGMLAACMGRDNQEAADLTESCLAARRKVILN